MVDTEDVELALFECAELIERSGLHLSNSDPEASQTIQRKLDRLLSEVEPRSLHEMACRSMSNMISEGGKREHQYSVHAPTDGKIKQIDAFDVLAAHHPGVAGMLQITVQQLFAIHPSSQGSIIMVDFGIGNGFVMDRYFEALNEVAVVSHPSEIIVIGVDMDPVSLQNCQNKLDTWAPLLPAVKLQFIKVCAMFEKVDFGFLMQQINLQQRQACDHGLEPVLVVHSAYALHHLTGTVERDTIIEEIGRLKPDLFLLCEPSVDHMDHGYARRVCTCYEHFQQVLGLVDESCAPEHADVIKNVFFKREIDDIMGTLEGQRVERHEPRDAWLQRLQNCKLLKPTNVNIVIKKDGAASFGKNCLLEMTCGYASIGLLSGKPIVTLFTWTRAAAPAQRVCLPCA